MEVFGAQWYQVVGLGKDSHLTADLFIGLIIFVIELRSEEVTCKLIYLSN